MGCKFKNILLTSILAVAGIFGVSSGIINKQVNKEPVAEKAEAIYGGTIWFTRPDTNQYTDTGITPWVTVHWEDGKWTNNGMSTAFTNWDGCGVFTYTLYSNIVEWNVHYKEKGGYEKWSDYWVEPGASNQGLYHSGWTYDGSSQFHMSTWPVRVVTFTYDGNGNDGGSTANTTNFYPDNRDSTLATNGFFKVGYKFAGWNTARDGSGYSFTSGGKLVKEYALNSTLVPDGGTITLYAQWTTEGAKGILWETDAGHTNWNTVYVWEKDQDGYRDAWPGVAGVSVTIGGRTYHYRDLNNLSFTPVGCIFMEKDASGYKTQDQSCAGHLDGNSFYRISSTGGENWVWFNFTRSISFKDQGGGAYTGSNSASLPSSVSYNSDTDLIDGTKSGYHFDGWYLNSACTGDAITAIYAGGYYTDTEPIIVYAKWTSGESAAISYATSFNSTIGGICSSYNTNTKSSFLSAWNSQKSTYNGLADYVKYWLAKSTASSDTNVTNMFAKYEYVLSKYGYSTTTTDLDLYDYLSRTPTPRAAIRDFSPLSLFGEEDSLSTVIIIVASSVALLSVTALSILVIKKRKNKEE